MRILFHAPLKPPDHPVPSGDREMARGLQRLLARLGHRVVMPAASRVTPGVPAPQEHLALERRARHQARRLIERWRALPARHPERFDLWFTYHCYYRKPDWLGPIVSRAVGVPYVIAEASHSPRRAQGPTRLGHRAVERALAAADLVLTVNPRDVPGVAARLRPGAHQRWLPPFIDAAPFRAAERPPRRPPVLLSVGMMRARDKLDSYRVLAAALLRLGDRDWRAVLVGDGPARGEVAALMAPLGDRVVFRGALPRDALPAVYAAADLYLWPAVNEAYGMAFLEAQAAGLPVVAGRSGGVPAVVADGVSGLLAPPGDAAAFAACVRRLLDDEEERGRMAEAAARRVLARHDEPAAARGARRGAEGPEVSVPFALLRHAPTDWNEARRLQGMTDTPLNPTGEALAAGWCLPAPAAGWRRMCSPLQRARRTAELLRPVGPVAVDSRLREMSFGVWEGFTIADLRQRIGPAFVEAESLGLDFHPPGGESPREVMQRLSGWTAEVATSGAPVMAVAHKAVLRAVLALATGWAMTDRPPVKLDWRALHFFVAHRHGAVAIDRLNVPLEAAP
jgi:glycosyltransferase involved in cell wall biosynthesis/broad specificity phosphatase PhoE